MKKDRELTVWKLLPVVWNIQRGGEAALSGRVCGTSSGLHKAYFSEASGYTLLHGPLSFSDQERPHSHQKELPSLLPFCLPMPAWCTLRSLGVFWLPGQGLPLVSQGVLVGCSTIPPNTSLLKSLQERQHQGLPCTASSHLPLALAQYLHTKERNLWKVGWWQRVTCVKTQHVLE